MRIVQQCTYYLCDVFTDLNSMSEQKKEGLSQLASMLELYMKQIPDLPALPTSCQETLSVIAKVGKMRINTVRLLLFAAYI